MSWAIKARNVWASARGLRPWASGNKAPRKALVAGAVAASAVTADAAPGGAPGAVAQRHEISTDVLKVDIDTLGASVVRAEMLQHRASGEAGGNMVLFDRSAGKTYVAQSGLIGQAAGDVPTHLTPFKLVSNERTRAEGQDTLVVKLASDPVAGVQLVRTYTFQRGSYLVDVRQEVLNQGAAAINPQLYVQLVRDGVAESGLKAFKFFEAARSAKC